MVPPRQQSQPELPPCAEHGTRIAALETAVAVIQALAAAKRSTLATWGPTLLMATLAVANLIELLLRKR